MLTVTLLAAVALSAALEDADEPSTRSIRLHARKDDDGTISIRLAIDDIQDDDKPIEFNGRVILVAEPDVAELVGDRTLTVEETEGGASFRLRPTAADAAGDELEPGQN